MRVFNVSWTRSKKGLTDLKRLYSINEKNDETVKFVHNQYKDCYSYSLQKTYVGEYGEYGEYKYTLHCYDKVDPWTVAFYAGDSEPESVNNGTQFIITEAHHRGKIIRSDRLLKKFEHMIMVAYAIYYYDVVVKRAGL